MRNFSFLLPLILLCFSPLAAADVYKCIDDEGRVTYTNDPGAARSCTRLKSEQAVSTIPSPTRPATPATTASTPADFPRVGANDQRARDDSRRQVLETELSNEQEALAAAEAELAEQDAVRFGDERNYQKKLDRLQPYQDKVDLHRRNIEALDKELTRLR